MKQPLRPMWDDPDESPVVRDLLRAGREDDAASYDVKQGLTTHLAHLAAGTAAPVWGHELMMSGSTVAVSGSVPFWGWMAASVLGAASGAYMWVADVPVAETVGSAGNRPDSALVVRAEGKRLPVSSADMVGVETRRAVVPATGVTGDPTAEPAIVASGIRPGASSAAASGASKGRFAAAGTASGGTASVKAELQIGVRADSSKVQPKGTVQRSAVESDTVLVAETVEGTMDARQENGGSKSRRAATLHPSQRTERIAVGSTAAPLTAAQPSGRASVQEHSENEVRLEREMRMLKVAQAILDSDPARSLRLTQQGEKEFKGSLFTQERRYVLISALARLGRTAEARRRATAYLSAYPTGPFSERVRQALRK